MATYRAHRIDTPSKPSHYRAFWQACGQVACIERWSKAAWIRLPENERPSDAFPTPNGWMTCQILGTQPVEIRPPKEIPGLRLEIRQDPMTESSDKS
jgi:hypothetical protein